ncbi:MAG: hypothetical protein RLZZ408_1240 [Verrucomicrobiota bacterium]|jgi:uncharacterized membrane protein YgdD (TMEM256/DUF423 family)
MNRRAALLVAGAMGFLGIALGAIGAHGLKGVLEANHGRDLWNTAVLYHLVHAPALLWAATAGPFLESYFKGAVLCWGFGIFLFSGSLYTLALTKIPWIGAITPIGGLLLMAGWVLVGIRAFKS